LNNGVILGKISADLPRDVNKRNLVNPDANMKNGRDVLKRNVSQNPKR
jgi:hypothetical protein